MATRFYPNRSTQATTLAAISASWEVTSSGFFRRYLGTVASGETFAGFSSSVFSGTNPNDQVLRQWISDPIAAQTITGTVKGQLMARETNAALNARAQMVIRVVNSDGSVERGVLLAEDSSALSSEFSTTTTNRKFPLAASSPATLSSVTALNGDRIVIELGVRAHSTDVTNTVTFNFGGNASDLPEDETTTTNGNPWIEFSATIAFYTPINFNDYEFVKVGDGMSTTEKIR